MMIYTSVSTVTTTMYVYCGNLRETDVVRSLLMKFSPFSRPLYKIIYIAQNTSVTREVKTTYTSNRTPAHFTVDNPLLPLLADAVELPLPETLEVDTASNGSVIVVPTKLPENESE